MTPTLRDLLHRAKRVVIGSQTARRVLRERVVTPFQISNFRRLADLLPSGGAADGPTVLVLAFRHWPISRAWEAVVSRYLEEKGARVLWVHCDRTMFRCDSMTEPERPTRLCGHCVSYNQEVAARLDIELVSLADYLDETDAPGVSGDEFATIEASLQRALGSRIPSKPDPSVDVIGAEMMWSADTVRRASRRLLDRVQPDSVLALNGKFFSERVVIEEATARGIDVWTYERGNRANTIVLTPTPVAVPFDTRTVRDSLQVPLTPSENATLDQYLERRRASGNGQVSFAPSGGNAMPAVLPGGRLLSAFTNLIWDSAVAGEDTIFSDMFEWLTATIDALAEDSSTRLVIRVHPAETRVYWHQTQERTEDVLAASYPDGLPSNVFVAGPDAAVDSYALMAQSDTVLVYTSTVGLEAAAMGRRVVVAGNSNYSGTPFVLTPATRDEYATLLAPSGEHVEVDLARRFIYRLYFELMTPVPYVVEDPTGFHVRRAKGDAASLRGLVEELVDDREWPAST